MSMPPQHPGTPPQSSQPGYPPQAGYGNPSQPGYPPQAGYGYPSQPGYPTAPGFAGGGYPPPINSSQLRPARWWYGIAGAIFLVTLIIGLVAGVFTASNAAPELNQEFDSGSDTTFNLDAGEELAIYVTGDLEERFDIDCSGSAELNFEDPKAEYGFSADGQTWLHAFNVTSDNNGDHRIFSCTADGNRTFALGDPAPVGAVAGGIAAAVGVPCLGLVTAGIIVLVVALQRKSHKQRLVAQRSGFGG